MKFRTILTEAFLLKRSFRFLMDVELKNKKRRTIYCPNLEVISHCEIPGLKLWFRSANRLSEGYLDVLELIEINAEEYIAINPDYAQALVREGIHHNIIAELNDYRFLHSNNLGNKHHQSIMLMIKENGEQCYIYIRPLFENNGRRESCFPENLYQDISCLNSLIVQKESGFRSVLFLSVQHGGVQCVRLADHHSVYARALQKAVAMGVEVIAYRANITLNELKVETRIPVLLSEDIISQ